MDIIITQYRVSWTQLNSRAIISVLIAKLEMKWGNSYSIELEFNSNWKHGCYCFLRLLGYLQVKHWMNISSENSHYRSFIPRPSSAASLKQSFNSRIKFSFIVLRVARSRGKCVGIPNWITNRIIGNWFLIPSAIQHTGILLGGARKEGRNNGRMDETGQEVKDVID